MQTPLSSGAVLGEFEPCHSCRRNLTRTRAVHMSASLPVRLRSCHPPCTHCDFFSVAACAIWAYGLEKEHKAHQAHLAEENDGHFPHPPAYDYLNRRVKPFPWGVNSLFFNPHVRFSRVTRKGAY